MTLDVLICTIDDGILRVPNVLLAPEEGVRYVVSFQVSDPSYRTMVPEELMIREDVCLSFLEDKGLSRNRNHALWLAHADVCLIADDDVRYRPDAFRKVLEVFREQPSLEMALFRAESYEGKPLKRYPKSEFAYGSRPRGYYPSSVEIAFRRNILDMGIRFDERFGLGAMEFSGGEDEVFVHEAYRRHCDIRYFPETLLQTDGRTTGTKIYKDSSLQRAKGAVMWKIYGSSASFRCLKFAVLSALKRRSAFKPLWQSMCEGIRAVQESE